MFSKVSPNSRGRRHSALAAKALAAGAALAVLGMTAGAASATTTLVYYESFGGSATGLLAGTAPTINHGTSSAWINQYSSTVSTNPDAQWQANGTITGSVDTNGNGALEVVALGFTPVSGQIYTLTANLLPTGYVSGQNANDGFVALGFADGQTGVPTFFQGQGPWMLSEYNGSTSSPSGQLQGYFGPNNTNGFTSSVSTLGEATTVILNTTQPNWGATEYYNGVLEGAWGYGVGNNTVNPTINEVAFGVNGTSAAVTNFSLTEQAVPEPASLGLAGVGALGLLLLKRRRNAM